MVRRSSPRGACAMSPSTRSKPVSENSRVTGGTDASDAEATAASATAAGEPAPVDALDAAAPDGEALKDAAGKPRSGKPMRPTQLELEVSRQRAIGWTIFGLILGGLLIRGLGTVGVWAGIALVATGLYHAWQLARTLLYPPGTIAVSHSDAPL